METRKILIINSSTQSQSVIKESRATTLGELKAEMRELNIPYSGMTFYEGHMRAELKDDASPLPTNIPYKGQVINDLTFMLTVPDKKVASGASKRKEVFDKITELGLQNECKKRIGTDYTHCTTADLLSLIEGAKGVNKKKKVTPVCFSEEADAVPQTEDSLPKAFNLLVEALYDNGVINSDTTAQIKSALTGKVSEAPEKMSKKEIDDMFSFLNK